MSEDVRIKTIGAIAGLGKKKETTISDVKQQAENMSVIDEAMDTAKKLAGTGPLQDEIARKDKKLDETEKQRDKAIEDKHKAEIEGVKTELGAKIDGLAKSYTGGASKESIAEQIVEIKKAASELGMGGSKISEIREMMNLITTLNPQKSLVDQIKDAKELITTVLPPADKGDGISIGGMPAAIALELKKMDTNLQITLETMKDERQRRDQEFALRLQEYKETRADRLQEAQGRIAVEQERNKMLAGGLETVGRAIGRGMTEGSRQGAQPPGSIGGGATEQPKSYHIELSPGEEAEFACPNCSAGIAVGPDSTQAQCVGCNSKFPVIRKPATPMPEPVPPSEEE